MKVSVFLIIVLILALSACQPSLPAPTQAPTTPALAETGTPVPSEPPAQPPATATSLPSPDATLTLPVVDPTADSTREALAGEVMAISQGELYNSYPAPDGLKRVDITVYDCVPVNEQVLAYEQMTLHGADGDAAGVAVDEELRFCEGLGAFGLQGIAWSPNSRYFYYNHAREGVPDGLCGYWTPETYRLDTGATAVERLGSGPFSPDKSQLAVWQDRELVIYDVEDGELGRLPEIMANAQHGPIYWSADGQQIVYLQSDTHCPPFGRSYVAVVDVEDMEQTLAYDAKNISLVRIEGVNGSRILLVDDQQERWELDLTSGKLNQVKP